MRGQRMRVRVALCLIATLTLTAATAVASTSGYKGEFDDYRTTSVSFKIGEKGGKTTISRIAVEAAPARCGKQKTGLNSSFKGSHPVSGNRFAVKSDNGLQKASFVGRLTKHGKKAKGTFTFSGFLDVNGQTEGCHTGYGKKLEALDWTASR